MSGRALPMILTLVVAAAGCHRRLPRYGEAPAFSAPSYSSDGSAGRPLSQAALAGAPWIADFVYTTCAGPCPGLSARMAALQAGLPASVRLVSFSVDPARDAPAALSAYARRFGADPARWRFVRPDERLLRSVTSGFKLALATDGAVVHSTKLVLVDAGGGIRGYYDGEDDAALSRLRSDAAALAR